MKCLSCGSEIIDDSKFCQSCGAPVQKVDEQVQSEVKPVEEQVHPEVKTQEKNSTLLLITFILILVSCIAVFLPYASALGIVNINYFKNGDQYLDGIFILILGAISFIFLALKKKIPVLILEIGVAIVFVYDWINVQNNLGVYSSLISYEIGFYLLLISILGVIIVSVLRIKNKNSK